MVVGEGLYYNILISCMSLIMRVVTYVDSCNS